VLSGSWASRPPRHSGRASIPCPSARYHPLRSPVTAARSPQNLVAVKSYHKKDKIKRQDQRQKDLTKQKWLVVKPFCLSTNKSFTLLLSRLSYHLFGMNLLLLYYIIYQNIVHITQILTWIKNVSILHKYTKP
jgi:hypothetical protein